MKQEVRRGRKFIEYQDDSLPVGTFVQEIGAHDVSYQDEAGSWRQLVEDWETDGADGFSFRASRMNHKVRFDSIGAWRWYPRRNVETEYLVINRPQCWLTATKRWGNLLVNGISREGKDITITSVRNVTRVIRSRWNGIKTDWILENANAPTRFRQKIDLVGITEIAGVLFGADGERLGQLTPTTATDANEVELPCSGSYSSGYVEFQADVTGAVYPVTIDPDFAVETNDTALFAIGTTSYANSRTINPLIYTTGGTYAPLGQFPDGAQFRIGRTFLKFDTSIIGAGSTVTQVNLKLSDNFAWRSVGIYVVPYDWSSNDPITTTNDWATFGGISGVTGEQGFTSIGTGTISSNLTTSIVNKTSYTYLGLLGAMDYTEQEQRDTADITYVCLSGHATESYRPVLIVAYTAGSAGVPKQYLHYARLRSN